MKRILITTLFMALCSSFFYAQEPQEGTVQEQQSNQATVHPKSKREKLSRKLRVNRWVRMADRAFDEGRFFKAQGYYDRAFRRAPEGDVRMKLRLRMGETQRQLNHPVEAVVYFDRVWGSNNRDIDFLESYADVLLKAADYVKAKFVYDMLYNASPNDKFIQNRLASCELGLAYVDTASILSQNDINRQNNLSTPFAEFGSTIVEGKLIFSSAQRVQPNTTDYQTGEGFSHFYEASYRIDSMSWESPSPMSFNIWSDNISDGGFSYDEVNKIGYFHRCNERYCEIYSTTREGNGWTVPQKVEISGLNPEYIVGEPTVSPDGQRMIVVARDPKGEGGSDLWIMNRIAPPLGQSRVSGSQDRTETVATRSKTSKAATAQTKKYKAAPAASKPASKSKKQSDLELSSEWSMAVNLGNVVNTKGDEVYPKWVNNKAFMFSSNGHVGYGGQDMYVAIADGNDVFGEIYHVEAPINTSFDDYSPAMAPSVERAYFSSSRYYNVGFSNEVYSFPKTASMLDIQFEVRDSVTKELLALTAVTVCDTNGCTTLYTDSLGQVAYVAPKAGNTYTMAFAKDGYQPDTMNPLQLNPALDIIPVRGQFTMTMELVPDYVQPEPEPELEPIPYKENPVEWIFASQPVVADTVDVLALAKMDTLTNLFGPENPCVEDLALIIRLDSSADYTQIGDMESLTAVQTKPHYVTEEVPVVDLDNPGDTIYRIDTISCEILYFAPEALFSIPVVANTPDDFVITGTYDYAAERPDTTMIFKNVPFSVPVKGVGEILDTTSVDTMPVEEPVLAAAEDSIPESIWHYSVNQSEEHSDTVNLVAMAMFDTLTKLLGPDNPCVEDLRLAIQLDSSSNYTQVGSIQTLSEAKQIAQASLDSNSENVPCDTSYFQPEALFAMPIVANTPDDFEVTGTINYTLVRPDTTIIFKEPFSILVEGVGEPIDTMPADEDPMLAAVVEDSVPPIVWTYSVNMPEEGNDTAYLVAKATIGESYELVSDEPQEDPFVPLTFAFNPDPNNYDLAGASTSNVPAEKKSFQLEENENVYHPLFMSYYKDSVTFAQPVILKNQNPFEVTGTTNYVLGQDEDYTSYANEPMTYPIPGRIEEEPQDDLPLISWYYSVDQFNDGTAELTAKAVIKKGAIMLSDLQVANELLSPITFEFVENPDQYELIGKPTADFRPIFVDDLLNSDFADVPDSIKNLEGRPAVPMSYFRDSVTFSQSIEVKSAEDFDVLGKMNYTLGFDKVFSPYTNVPLSFPIFGIEQEEEPVPAPVDDRPLFTNKVQVKEREDLDMSDCMRPGMTPEEVIECLNRTKQENHVAQNEQEEVDVRIVHNYQDRINDPNRRANMEVLPPNVPCVDCGEQPVQHQTSEELYIQSGDDKKTLKFTDNAGNVTYLDLAPNTKYHINVSNALADLMAKLPENVEKSDLVKTAKTKDYIVYECLPKLAEVGEEVYVNNIYYDFDKSEVIRDGNRELDKMVIIAIKNPQLTFEVTAHADERGSDEYNVALTERRLKSVTDYLAKKGLDLGRLITKAAGKSEPLLVHAGNDDEHALNRRTTIRLYNAQATNMLQSVDYEVPENKPFDRRGLRFRVQVGAFKEAPEYPLYLFKDHINAATSERLSYYQDRDGLYKFTIGDFTDLEQARRICRGILEANKECYVVAFIDGQRITVAEAQMWIVNQKRNGNR
ncbi:MAG: OmpA family protein [Bacteroidales bacterium]|jgi:outer membrane protein OmpA-like peptidoglycan-associated protein|nr:OmpA family protein [Bacteroidales bacterium]